MKKRLAVIGGGAHTIPSYRALLKLLALEYDIFLFSEFYIKPEKMVNEYTIISVPQTNVFNHNTKMNWRWRVMRFSWIVLKGCLQYRIDVIHSHSTYPSGFMAILAGKIFRIPVVVSLNAAEAIGLADIMFGDILQSKLRLINRWVIHSANRLTVLTHFQLNEVRKGLKLLRKIHVIPRGVDTKKFIPSGEKLQKGKPVKFFNIAYIHPVKDQVTLLKAFKIISEYIDATLVLIGIDYENRKIHSLADELGLSNKVFFEGFIPHDSISRYYASADILLHTSRYESQAVTVVEAMASGVLVCGTHVGIMADLSGKCCITAPVQAPAILAQKIINLLMQPDEQVRLRASALEWVEKHSISWTAQQYMSLYVQLLNE